jgi:subtilisin family serine protease
VYRVPNGADPLRVSNALAQSGAVEFSVPDFQLHRVAYSGGGTNDPLFTDQWHLESTGQLGAQVDADIDAAGAWATTRGDSEVVIAVIDSGCDLGHPDLAANYAGGIDVLENDDDPSAENYLFGFSVDKHGTSVAGVAAGIGNNGEGISGVAQACGHMAIRFLSDGNPFIQPTLQDEAESWNFARQNGASVVNCSWGPSVAAPLAAPTQAAIDDSNENGRGGLGMVTLFAAGNSNSDNSGNGYASYEGVIGVAASNDQDTRASYSSFGASVDICAPSNGGLNGITTTDRVGVIGYSTNDYTNTFGGTSSASPCAAGVFLLVFSANPNLTREEAIAIVEDTAVKIDQAGGSYDSNGHSNFYGYGKVNAQAAVEAAASGGGCAATSYCAQSPNSSGGSGVIAHSGSTSVSADDFVIEAASCATGQFGIFYYGPNQVSVPFGDGLRCVSGQTHRLPVVQTDGFGDVSHAVDLNSEGVAAGDNWNFQFWFRDGSSFNLTDGLEVEFCQ